MRRVLELLAGHTDAFQGAVFDEFLGGFGDDADAAAGIGRGDRHGHSAPDAMAECDEAGQLEMGRQRGEGVARLIADKIRLQTAGVRVRLAETQPVVGDDRPPRGLGKLGWEITPQVHASQRVVQQDDGRASLRIGPARPLPGVDPPLCGGDQATFWRGRGVLNHPESSVQSLGFADSAANRADRQLPPACQGGPRGAPRAGLSRPVRPAARPASEAPSRGRRPAA
ncbi:hypothetical protein G6F57_018584 [Rhizopus arrhizus]|nr:hypothetical protein G6F57_018584 [Rhizopus arrhizus]